MRRGGRRADIISSVLNIRHISYITSYGICFLRAHLAQLAFYRPQAVIIPGFHHICLTRASFALCHFSVWTSLPC